MIETAKPGIAYGVETRYSEHPRADWIARYGWFPQIGEDGRFGYDRAMECYDHLTDVEHVDAALVRVVKRETKVTVVRGRRSKHV